MLQVFQSNRLEDLATLLAGRVAGRESELFSPELIVVQHPGVGRWLSLFLSDQLGICANTQFPLPATFIWQQLQGLLGEHPEGDGYQVANMQWHIFDILSQRGLEHSSAHLVNYLQTSTDLDRFELSGEIARCFDRYLVYRPDWILAWQAGECAVDGDEWQAELWRLLERRIGKQHWAYQQLQVKNAVAQRKVHTQSLPDHASLFAPSLLSPSYLYVLQTIAKWMEIDLYLLNPSEGHWIDLVTPKQFAQRHLEGDERSLYLEVGNPILASLGIQRRDFFSQLLDLDVVTVDGFVQPEGTDILQLLQRHIFSITSPNSRSATVLRSTDCSLQFHACHSPMREVEVLRDQLLEILNSNPDISPEDIAVMTPDMDTYAPLIEAVFAENGGVGHIPFNMSDQSDSSAQQIANGLSALLALPGGRYGVEEVIALLEIPLVSRNFGIEPADLPRVIDWIETSGIRWGLDDSHRAQHGQPETRVNSWSWGIDRLLLGYAMPSGADCLINDLLPITDIEGSESQLLGGVCDFLKALKEVDETFKGERSWKEWQQLIEKAMQRFMCLDDAEDDAQWLRNQLLEVFQLIETADVSQVISFNLLQNLIDNQLAASISTTRFLAGGITFCAFSPMRTLPFKVICLVGMSEQSFPRSEVPIGFDLMANDYRLGDRSKRGDDQSLFLETLISARDILYISFVGNSIKDNSDIPPSVVIGDLLDYLDKVLVSESGQLPSQCLVTKHPLQAFSHRYFDQPSKLFSYSDENCRGADGLRSGDYLCEPFIDHPLDEPEEQWKQISLEQLLEFYRNPTRYLLRRRLGILMTAGEALLESRDPFHLSYFKKSDMFLRLMKAFDAEQDVDDVIRQELSRGELSHGKLGELELSSIVYQTQKIRGQIQQIAPQISSSWISHDFTHGGLRLQGGQRTYSKGILGSSIHQLSAAALIEQWIRHLALNTANSGGNGFPQSNIWFEPGRRIVFKPVENASEYLSCFLDNYWQGLHSPLYFFPKSSLAYAKKYHVRKDREEAIKDAEKTWRGDYMAAESDNAYYQRAFSDDMQLDQNFCQLSETLLLPMLDHMEDG